MTTRTGAMPVRAFGYKAWHLTATLLVVLSPLGLCKTLEEKNPSDQTGKSGTSLARTVQHRGRAGVHKTPHHAHLAPAGGKPTVLAQTGLKLGGQGDDNEAKDAVGTVEAGKRFEGVSKFGEGLNMKVDELDNVVKAAAQIKEEELKANSQYSLDVADTHKKLTAAKVREIDLKAQNLLQLVHTEPGRVEKLHTPLTHTSLMEPGVKNAMEATKNAIEAGEGSKTMAEMFTTVGDVLSAAVKSASYTKDAGGPPEVHQDMKTSFEQAATALNQKKEAFAVKEAEFKQQLEEAKTTQKDEVDRANKEIEDQLKAENIVKALDTAAPVEQSVEQSSSIVQLGETVAKVQPPDQTSTLQLTATVGKVAPSQQLPPPASILQVGAQASTAPQLVPSAPVRSIAQLDDHMKAAQPVEKTVYFQASRLRGLLDRIRQNEDKLASPATSRTASAEPTTAHLAVSKGTPANLQKSA